MASMTLALVLGNSLDKFVGIFGAFLCAPVGLLYPTFLHLKVITEKPTERVIDLILIVVSIAIFIFCINEAIRQF